MDIEEKLFEIGENVAKTTNAVENLENKVEDSINKLSCRIEKVENKMNNGLIGMLFSSAAVIGIIITVPQHKICQSIRIMKDLIIDFIGKKYVN